MVFDVLIEEVLDKAEEAAACKDGNRVASLLLWSVRAMRQDFKPNGELGRHPCWRHYGSLFQWLYNGAAVTYEEPFADLPVDLYEPTSNNLIAELDRRHQARTDVRLSAIGHNPREHRLPGDLPDIII